MKVGIIHISAFVGCPYLVKYTDILKENNIEYELIGWDRTGVLKNDMENRILFRLKSDENKSIIKKLPDFIKYAKFLNKKIKESKYDKIIILNTLTAFLVINNIKKYANRFIFDIRDLSYEYIPLFKKILGWIINKSYFTCISSLGFKNELPEGRDYVMAHNFQYSVLENNTEMNYKKNIDSPLNILFIGIGRGDNYNKTIADIFGNDKRFNVYFVGAFNATKFFKNYVKKYDNIFVQGKYNDAEKKKFIDKADIMMYNYMSNFNCDCALANKYYDGLIYKKPLLGNIDTYSGKLINERKVGISLSFNDEKYADKLYDYYINLNENEYLLNVDKEIDRVLCDDKYYLQKIEQFLRG